MTTPERLRRRQLVEGTILICLAIGMLFQTWYFNRVDQDQSDCISEKFTELSKALDVRSELTARESNASKRIWLVWAEAAGLVKDDPSKPLNKQDQERLNRRLVKVLLAYKSDIEEIQRSRKEHPLPPYPIGTCER